MILSTRVCCHLARHTTPVHALQHRCRALRSQSRVFAPSRRSLALLTFSVSLVACASLYTATAHSQSTNTDATTNTNNGVSASVGDDDNELRVRIPGLSAAKKALSILLYESPDQPPPIHNPSPPDGMPALKYPVVLVHGFLGYSSLFTNPLNQRPMFEYFGEVRQMYEDAGYTVIVPVLPRSYKIENRAKALQVAIGLAETRTVTMRKDGTQVTQEVTPVSSSEKADVEAIKDDASTINTGNMSTVTVLSNCKLDLSQYHGPFHIVSHSMGGLDSRYLITHLQPEIENENRVLSLTTIGSPHHGSPIADVIVEQVQKERRLPQLSYNQGLFTNTSNASKNDTSDTDIEGIKVEQIVQFVQDVFHLDFQGMLDLTTSATTQFNADTPNRPKTHYFSYAGWRRFEPWSVWFGFSKIIEAREGFNDGLVSMKSAQWGKFVGVLPLDHLQQIGLGVMHRHLPLYREIAWNLHAIEQRYGEEEDRLTRKREARGKPSAHDDRRQNEREQRAGERREAQRERAKDEAQPQ